MKKFLIILLIAVLCLSGCTQNKGSESSGLTSFSAYDLNGTEQNESIFAGKKLTMINVWATYCGPCIQEMPGLAAIAEKYRNSDFQIVGIVTDVTDHEGNTAENARAILKNADANYVNLLPDHSMMSLLENVMYVPTTIFVDETGAQVGSEYIGSREQKDWEAIITQLLEDAA